MSTATGQEVRRGLVVACRVARIVHHNADLEYAHARCYYERALEQLTRLEWQLTEQERREVER